MSDVMSEKEDEAVATWTPLEDFVSRPEQVRARVWQGEQPDPDTGAQKGQVVVFDSDNFEVMPAGAFNARYQMAPPQFLGHIKMAVGNTRLDGKRLSFVGTPQEVCAAQEEYAQANPTHMFCDEKLVVLPDGRLCSLVLVDRVGREESARYARELTIQARVRAEMEQEDAEQLAKRPKLLAVARAVADEYEAQRKKEQEELKALAEVGRVCRKNHGKTKGKK